ncbi:hypothetical protein C8R45DRAFT_1077791 [Mycena sanguinolenta]|nr:hypothetical protein C8R45DRAFT_1077791 [Mycena sanguinolenta]
MHSRGLAEGLGRRGGAVVYRDEDVGEAIQVIVLASVRRERPGASASPGWLVLHLHHFFHLRFPLLPAFLEGVDCHVPSTPNESHGETKHARTPRSRKYSKTRCTERAAARRMKIVASRMAGSSTSKHEEPEHEDREARAVMWKQQDTLPEDVEAVLDERMKTAAAAANGREARRASAIYFRAPRSQLWQMYEQTVQEMGAEWQHQANRAPARNVGAPEAVATAQGTERRREASCAADSIEWDPNEAKAEPPGRQMQWPSHVASSHFGAACLAAADQHYIVRSREERPRRAVCGSTPRAAKNQRTRSCHLREKEPNIRRLGVVGRSRKDN